MQSWEPETYRIETCVTRPRINGKDKLLVPFNYEWQYPPPFTAILLLILLHGTDGQRLIDAWGMARFYRRRFEYVIVGPRLRVSLFCGLQNPGSFCGFPFSSSKIR